MTMIAVVMERISDTVARVVARILAGRERRARVLRRLNGKCGASTRVLGAPECVRFPPASELCAAGRRILPLTLPAQAKAGFAGSIYGAPATRMNGATYAQGLRACDGPLIEGPTNRETSGAAAEDAGGDCAARPQHGGATVRADGMRGI